MEVAFQLAGAAGVRLSTVVMAHPRRRADAMRIQGEYPELNIRIVFDPEPEGPPATLRTARAAWAAVDDAATHHLVLQDDVLLCADFPRVVTQALEAAPEGAVALFAPWSMATSQAVRLAALVGASWTRLQDGWTPTQALALPAEWARQFGAVAADLPDTEPDNRAMYSFLAERGRSTYVAIPSLVEHAPAESLLFNDLLHGVREATVFAGTDPGRQAFTDRVVSPPAVSHVWMGAGEYYSSYNPADPTPRAMVTPTHEVLTQFGMANEDLAAVFAEDLGRHPELATDSPVGECLHFSMWLTMFASGIIAAAVLDEPSSAALDTAWKQPWAEDALATFPAATLRKIASREALGPAAETLVPFCRSAMHSGVTAVDRWPGLTALWNPHAHEIVPHWARAKAGADR